MLSSFFVPKYAIKAASCHASREAASGRFGWWQVLWIGVLHLKKAILEENTEEADDLADEIRELIELEG